MKFLKIDTNGRFMALERLDHDDIQQALNGECLLVDMERELMLSPATERGWEKIERVVSVSAPSYLYH